MCASIWMGMIKVTKNYNERMSISQLSMCVLHLKYLKRIEMIEFKEYFTKENYKQLNITITCTL